MIADILGVPGTVNGMSIVPVSADWIPRGETIPAVLVLADRTLHMLAPLILFDRPIALIARAAFRMLGEVGIIGLLFRFGQLAFSFRAFLVDFIARFAIMPWHLVHVARLSLAADAGHDWLRFALIMDLAGLTAWGKAAAESVKVRDRFVRGTHVISVASERRSNGNGIVQLPLKHVLWCKVLHVLVFQSSTTQRALHLVPGLILLLSRKRFL